MPPPKRTSQFFLFFNITTRWASHPLWLPLRSGSHLFSDDFAQKATQLPPGLYSKKSESPGDRQIIAHDFDARKYQRRWFSWCFYGLPGRNPGIPSPLVRWNEVPRENFGNNPTMRRCALGEIRILHVYMYYMHVISYKRLRVAVWAR